MDLAELLRQHGGLDHPPTIDDILDAIKSDNLDKVKALLKDDPDLVYSGDIISGMTPLHMAAFMGYREIVESLLADKADVNAKAVNGMTPLHYAVMKGYKDVVELLLANKADINAKNNNGGTPLHLAANKDVAELLLANKADVNAKNNYGETPLHLAANKDVVELLLANKADVNAKNNNGGTPLHLAANKDVAELLLANKADVNARNNNGETPLHLAANKDVVELLLADKADVNAKDNNGETPLHLAVANENWDVAELLRQHGAANLPLTTTKTAFEEIQALLENKTDVQQLQPLLPPTTIQASEVVVTKDVITWQKNCDEGNYAPERYTGLPLGEKITGQGMGIYCISRTNGGYVASTSIFSSDGKTSTQGKLVKIRTIRVNGNPNNANAYISHVMLSGYVCTPRVSSIGKLKLDLSGTSKITDSPDFSFESFKNSPFVIPFSNGYAVNIFLQEVNDDGVLLTANRYYVSDEGKRLYGRLVRSHFGKLEEIIIGNNHY
jgi:ankyrin repeat protein